MKLVLISIAAALVGLAVAGPAFADVHVARGQVVTELRVVAQSVRVDGRARGPVVVVGGSLTVGATGEVANVTVIGGHLRTAPGARVRGDVFQFGGAWPALDGWRVLLAIGLALLARTIVVWLVVAAARLAAARPRIDDVLAVARDRPGRALLVGALAWSGLLALSVLLAISLIGLVVAFALWGLLALAAMTGVALGFHTLENDRAAYRIVLASLAIPVLGDALIALAGVVGLGTLLRYSTASTARTEAFPDW